MKHLSRVTGAETKAGELYDNTMAWLSHCLSVTYRRSATERGSKAFLRPQQGRRGGIKGDRLSQPTPGQVAWGQRTRDAALWC
jgi:hypothetical protein